MLNLEYQYTNATGKRTGQLTKILNNLNHNKDRGYAYDALGRLTQATGGQASTPLWTQTYSYDRYGNRLSVTASGYSASLRERNGSEPRAVATGSNTLLSSPSLDLLAKNNTDPPTRRAGGNPTVREGAESVSDSPPTLRAASRDARTRSAVASPPQGAPTFSDDPLTAGVTIKAVHITELRTAIDQARVRAGLSAASWAESISSGVTAKASHITEMRTRLAEARAALGLSAATYTDPNLAAGYTVKAVHIQELRDRVREASGSSLPIPRDGLASLTYDTATNRITTSGFAYDAAGNQVRAIGPNGSSSQRYKYDAANRLVQVLADDNTTVIATYTYGDSNERLIADEGGYRTYYACGGSVEYIESGGSTTPTWSKSYVYLGARLLSTLTPNGSGGEAIQYHHPDRLGTRLVTNPSDGSYFEQQTLPFGTALNETPPSGGTFGATNRRFTSYDRSATTGLDYAANRHYDPQQGRFTQVDSAGMGATSLTSPQTLNLYAYCVNDPLNHSDPSGLGFFSFLKKVFKGILKVLSNKWVQIALMVAMVAILHFYYHYSFGFTVASNASKAAPVLHAAATGGTLAAGGGAAASGVLTGVVVADLEAPIVVNALADLGTLALAGALGAGAAAQLGQHSEAAKGQDNKPSGGKTGPCPGFAKKFFDSTFDILKSLALNLQVDPLLIITHASFESGWLDAHNRALNNLFGYTHAGGRNQSFSSLQAAADAYANHTGPIIQGSRTADDFLGKLGAAHYNKDMETYATRFKARMADVKKFGNGCGVLAP